MLRSFQPWGDFHSGHIFWVASLIHSLIFDSLKRTDLSSFTLTGAAADNVILAGEDVTYTYEVTDAFGNPVAVPIDVIVNDPGAIVLDDGLSGAGTISGVVRASTVPYTITALIAGTTISESRQVTVGVADGQRTSQ